MSHANGGTFPGTPDNADEPCGAKDLSALLPEPVHYECRECKAVIVTVLKMRVPPRDLGPIVESGDLFPDLQPVQRTKFTRGGN